VQRARKGGSSAGSNGKPDQGSGSTPPPTSLDDWSAEGFDDLWAESPAAGRARERARARAEAPPPRTRRPRTARTTSGGNGPRRPPRSPLTPVDRRRRRRRVVGLTRLAVAVGLLVLIILGVITLFKKIAAPSLDATGPKDGAVLGVPGLAKLTFSAKGTAADLANQQWRLDGKEVRPRAGKKLIVYRPRTLRDGKHTFEIKATGGFLGASATKSWSFTVDTTPPKVKLVSPVVAYASQPIRAKGTITEDGVLRANRTRVPVKDGTWQINYAAPPAGAIVLTATDEVGNSARWRMPITIVPREPREPIRAVHVSADGWANSTLRQGVLQLIDQGRINTVELDLKDEAGVIGWSAPGLNRYGAVRNTYDLGAAVKQLHAKGVRVVGRLVAFRDPIAAQSAWDAGRHDEVIQTPDGSMYTSDYGGFSNFANAKVRQYNIAIAVAAAKLGVDDILYDYIRRPDGPIDTMSFPGIKGSAERSIAAFAGQTRKALRPYKTFLGASVFGIAATHPEDVAQNIPMMAHELDYVSPMVYPSHWGPGEYNVADPNSQPYDIVFRSLEDFERQVKGTGSRVVPWLQDFYEYGPTEVSAQIRAAKDAGANEFLLWDPEVTYTADGVPATAKMPATGTAKSPKLPKGTPGLQFLGSTKPAVTTPTRIGPVTPSPAGSAPPNELGQIPVLMHHQISNDKSNVYDLTASEFRAELQRLWKDGFVPITASALVNVKIDIAKDRRPVVMTFDDGTKSQFALLPDGNVDPNTAVGIMMAFGQKHPDFKPAGTFYVNADPFELGGNLSRGLRWLTTHGFEIGNHTTSHADLSSLDATGVQKELATDAKMIVDALPGYKIRTMALPFGITPSPASLAVRGSWGGTSYGPYGVMLVGANPSPSPFSGDFDPAAVPRIRSAHQPWQTKQDYEWDYWQNVLEENPSSVYVSDGNPRTISFPKSEEGSLSSRFKARAKPY
jgi:peptidoglycan/xylan/chitin deacetylase (PgdA/CDA1 family)